MQTIQANNYNVYFDTIGYDFLTSTLVSSNYSKIFIIVDEHTSQFCLPHLLNNLATEIEIEIIELETGEIHKNIGTCTEVWGALTELGAGTISGTHPGAGNGWCWATNSASPNARVNKT